MNIAGTFTVTSWDEQPYREQEGAARLTRASIVQDFVGDLEATAPAELLMCYRPDGTAAIVGLQRFEGRIGDRSGGFVARYTGEYDGGEARATLSVIPGSGSGGLAGTRGEGTVAAGHDPPGTYEFDLAV